MINLLINDINKALDAEAYIAALSLALTLPDICSRAEYGSQIKSNKQRYIKWFDENIGQYEKAPKAYPEEPDMPYLSGEVVYQLRCSVLHEGNPNVDKSKIHDDCCKIDRFTLVVEKKKRFDIYPDSSSVIETLNPKEPTIKTYRVNIRRLCLIICLTANDFYKRNKEKFNFFDYEILDSDQNFKRIDNEQII